MPGRSDTNKQAIKGLFQAINERRLADLPEYMALNVVDHNKIIHGEADQPGAAFDGFRQQFGAFTDGGMFVQDLIAEGDRVVARLLVSGVHMGFHPRMPEPTGRRFEVEQIWISA